MQLPLGDDAEGSNFVHGDTSEDPDVIVYKFALWLAKQTKSTKAKRVTKMSDFSLEDAVKCNNEWMLKLLYFYARASKEVPEYEKLSMDDLIATAKHGHKENNLLRRIVMLSEGILSTRVSVTIHTCY